MPEKWIVFDAMGVIFIDAEDVNDLLLPFLQMREPGVNRERINEVYHRASLGLISSREFWTKLGFSSEYPAIELEYLDSRLRLDLEFIPIASKLGSEYNLALLANDVAEWSAYLRGKYNLNCLFKAVVISGEAGLRKPDPAIYQLLLDKTGARAANCIFIDDRQNNLDAAAMLGFQTIRFLRNSEKNNRSVAHPLIYAFPELQTVLKEKFLTG
jgi:FMN phosphatase YigB (HAD superfamily)